MNALKSEPHGGGLKPGLRTPRTPARTPQTGRIQSVPVGAILMRGRSYSSSSSSFVLVLDSFLPIGVCWRLLAVTSIKFSLVIALLMINLCTKAQNPVPSTINFGWWPAQAMPKALVRTTNRNDLPLLGASRDMMLQSVAGLVARAVNDGRSDEMVWVGTDNV